MYNPDIIIHSSHWSFTHKGGGIFKIASSHPQPLWFKFGETVIDWQIGSN